MSLNRVSERLHEMIAAASPEDVEGVIRELERSGALAKSRVDGALAQSFGVFEMESMLRGILLASVDASAYPGKVMPWKPDIKPLARFLQYHWLAGRSVLVKDLKQIGGEIHPTLYRCSIEWRKAKDTARHLHRMEVKLTSYRTCLITLIVSVDAGVNWFPSLRVTLARSEMYLWIPYAIRLADGVLGTDCLYPTRVWDQSIPLQTQNEIYTVAAAKARGWAK